MTYAEFDREDIEKVGDANVVKLFRVAQMSIEYLIYTQNYLETLTKSLDAHYKHVYEEEARVKDKARAQASECAQLKRDLALKTKTLSTYEYLLKLPSQNDSSLYKCNQCQKVFISHDYVQKHYSRKHPSVNFQKDFKPPPAPTATSQPAKEQQLSTAQIARE